MRKNLKILMVDDHPMILEGYKNALNQNAGLDLLINSANNCDEAHFKLKSASHKPYNIVFLDIKIPECSDGRFLSGEDLGLYIKKEYPETKLIVLTMFNESLRWESIIKNLKPHGFLIKSDVTPSELNRALDVVSQNGNYYSSSISKYLNLQKGESFNLDENDRRILFYLSKGTQTKDLIEFIPLSLPAIEKRKRKIRDVFGITESGDMALLKKAEELGFI